MNQLLKRLMIFLIACLFAAAPLQAATVNWISNGVPPQDQAFGNANNWDGVVDIDAFLHVNNAAPGQYPKLLSGTASVDGLYLGDTASAELDIANATLNLSYYFRMGTVAEPSGPTTSTLKMSAAILNKLDPLGTVGENVWLGGSDGATANIEMTNGSEMNIPLGYSVSFGRNAGAACNLTMDHSTLNFGALGVGEIGAYYWQWVSFVGRADGTGTVNMTDSHWNQFNTGIQVGHSGGNGTINMMGASTILMKPEQNESSDGVFYIGINGFGEVNMYDTSTVTIGYGGLSLGNGFGAIGTLTMTDDTSMACQSAEIGVGGAQGTLEMSLRAAITVTNPEGDGFRIATGGGVGNVIMNDSSSLTTPFIKLGSEGGLATLTLNGGTLRPSKNIANFMDTSEAGEETSHVYVCEQGATIDVGTDDSGHPLTVGLGVKLEQGGGLGIDGGLTKTGVGRLLYNGVAFYTGDTRVDQGSLGGTGVLWGSKIVLASTGDLSPGDPSNIGSSFTAAELDASAGGHITNAIDCFTGVSNSLQILGSATLTNTRFAFDFANGTPNGTYTLLTTGGGVTAAGLDIDWDNIPDTRVMALALSTDDYSVYLTASATGNEALNDVWTGAISGDWDKGADGTANWSNGGDSKFMDWDHVLFVSSDNRPNITLNEHVYVPDLFFTGTNNYVISGTGKITGLSNASGAVLTVVHGSVDFQTNGNVFSGIILDGGAISFTDSANTADLLMVYPDSTLTLNGTGSLHVNGGGGDFVQVGVNPGLPSKLALTDHSAFTVGYGSAIIGNNGGDGTLEMTGSSKYENLPSDWSITFVGLNPDSKGTLTMGRGTEVNEDPSLTVHNGILSVGNSGGEGVIAMGHYATIHADDKIEFGVNGGSATVEMYGHAVMTANNNINISDSEGSATVTMNDQSSMVVGGGVCFIGVYGGNGTLIMSGGTSPADLGSYFEVNGTLSCGNSAGGTGVYGQAAITMSGYSSIYARDGFEIGTNGGSGTLDASGHAAIVIGSGGFRLGSWGGGVGTATLNESSSITTDFVLLGDDGISGTLYLNGGTLRPTQNHTDFINKPNGSVYVCEGGATFDIGADGGGTPLVVGGIGIELLHSFLGPEDVPDGGLTKTGPGVLILTATPTYNGNTAIEDGILQFAVPGEVILTTVTGSDAGTLSVCDGTTLTATSIQVGTLSIGGAPIPFPASATVPEPGTIVLLTLAGLMIAGAYLRRK